MSSDPNFAKGFRENSSYRTFVEKLEVLIEANFNNNQFGVDNLAQSIGMSRSSLHRKLHRNLGISTSQFIREFRLKRALDILREEDTTASEAAFRVGFNSATYFNTCFAEYYGYPPGEVKYRTEKSTLPIDTISHTENTIPQRSRTAFGKITLLVLVSLTLLLMGFFVVSALSESNSQIAMPELVTSSNSIAIIPFKNLSVTKENEYFTAGITQSIQNHLNKIPGLKLISETSMDQYNITSKTSPEIAAELNVSHLLEASVQQYENKVRVIVKLIDAKKDQQIWSDTYDRDLVDIFNIQSEISKQIALSLEIVLSPSQISQIDRIPTTDIDAYNLYQKGRHFFNYKTHSHGDGEKSIYYFNQAIKRDPEFALAYAALATAHLFSGRNLYITDSVKVVEELALKAIALDNTISEAHVVLGTLACMYEWNWDKAQKEYEQAIQLNPNNSNAYIYYSQFLFSVRGEYDKAREHIDMALRLDPLSYMSVLKSAQFYYYEGKYNQAFQETAKLKEMNDHNMFGYFVNFQNYESQEMNDKALLELLEYFEKEPTVHISVDSLKAFYSTQGMKGVYSYLMQYNYHTFGLPSNYPDFELYMDARSYSHIGDHEKALEYLELSFARRSSYLYLIKHDISFKNLRSHPRYLNILNKMDLGA